MDSKYKLSFTEFITLPIPKLCKHCVGPSSELGLLQSLVGLFAIGLLTAAPMLIDALSPSLLPPPTLATYSLFIPFYF